MISGHAETIRTTAAGPRGGPERKSGGSPRLDSCPESADHCSRGLSVAGARPLDARRFVRNGCWIPSRGIHPAQPAAEIAVYDLVR
jgi:hypothetical protein